MRVAERRPEGAGQVREIHQLVRRGPGAAAPGQYSTASRWYVVSTQKSPAFALMESTY